MAVKKNGILNLKVNSDTYLSADSSMLVLGEIKYIQKYFHV